jgi:hypothetical protein
MQKGLYPENWKEIRESVKERAGWQCEICGIAEGTLQTGKTSGKLYIIYLHAAHLDADPQNPYARLVALCPSCHMRHDRREELQERVSTRRRGYHITTTDKLIKALSVAGLELTETADGYAWRVDDLSGKATSAVSAVSDAVYYLRQARNKHGGKRTPPSKR